MSRVRHVTKWPFQYIPFFGQTFITHWCLYLKSGKGGEFDPKPMTKILDYLKDNELSSWIILYPEGTFFDHSYPKVLAQSRNYCQQIGCEPYEHLLIPRSRALIALCKQFRHRFDAIVDITLIYPNTKGKDGSRVSSPSIIEYFSGFHREIEIHVKYIKTKEMPETDNELEKWLHNLYRKKDKQLSEFYSDNKTIEEVFNCKPGIVCPNPSITRSLLCLIALVAYLYLLSVSPKIYFMFCISISIISVVHVFLAF